MSPLATAWRLAASAAAPLLPAYLRRRVARGKEVPDRLTERFGEGAARPAGPLLWLHAASVGETLSILPLIEALGRAMPSLRFLVTTGTVTSATLLGQRLPAALAPRVAHRFVPLDVPRWVARFLDGWRPDAAVFAESELWPNLIAAAAARGIPLALVNARMSDRSAAWWRRAPGLARAVLDPFRLVLAQTEGDAARLRALGAPAHCLGNLKYAAAPLPVDAGELDRLRGLLAGRPAWLAASTHPGEEAIVIAAHRRLAAAHPGLLTMIVPRHPERGRRLRRWPRASPPPAAPPARTPPRGSRCSSPTRWANSACSTAWRAAPSSAGPWCRMAARTRWNRRGCAAPCWSARRPGTSPR